MKAFVPAALLCAVSTPASAEPVGRWWAGWGQGTAEYGIKNDSKGSDAIYIACAPDNTYVSFTVGGTKPKQGSKIFVVIGADEFEIYAGKNGYMQTASHVESDTFYALWDAMRKGSVARVRLSTGESTVFTLKGAAKALGAKPCDTDFARP